MNDTAQETTAVMATLVKQEVLGTSLLPVEGEQKKEIIPSHIAALLLLKVARSPVFSRPTSLESKLIEFFVFVKF